MNNTGARPLGDKILVRRDESKKQQWVLRPDGLEEWPWIGTVLAVGEKVTDPDIVPGVRVLLQPKPGSALIIDDREPDQKKEWERVTVIPLENVLGIVEEE